MTGWPGRRCCSASGPRPRTTRCSSAPSTPTTLIILFCRQSTGRFSVRTSCCRSEPPSWATCSTRQAPGGSDFSFAGQSNIKNSTTYDFGATGTKFLSGHTVKFGFEHRRYYDNYTDGGGGDGQGSFNQ